MYPYNEDMEEYDKDFFKDDIDIIDYNKKIKALATKLKVSYLDVYNELNKDNKLDSIYTDDGIHLNDKGYDKLNKLVTITIEGEHGKTKD